MLAAGRLIPKIAHCTLIAIKTLVSIRVIRSHRHQDPVSCVLARAKALEVAPKTTGGPTPRRRGICVRSCVSPHTAGPMTALAIAPSHAAESANVALGRPYTVDPKPNYSGGTSASGATELTDGVVTQSGTMWTQHSAVGWTHVRPITITIDLGRTISVGR